MNFRDQAHEAAIRACFERWMAGQAKWSELCELIAMRSPDAIADMERAKGLDRRFDARTQAFLRGESCRRA